MGQFIQKFIKNISPFYALLQLNINMEKKKNENQKLKKKNISQLFALLMFPVYPFIFYSGYSCLTMILQKLSINGMVLHPCCVLPQQLKEKKKKCWSLLCYRISLLVTLAEKHATGLCYVHQLIWGSCFTTETELPSVMPASGQA